MPGQQIKVIDLITHKYKCIGGFNPEKVDGKTTITMKPTKEPVMFYVDELREILNKIAQ